jgi:tetratricopeptide (TPR) repeat protein
MNHRNTLFAILALFLGSCCAEACIWVLGTKYNTRPAWVSGFSTGRRLRLFLEHPRVDGEKMEAELRGSTKFNDRSDYAVALLYLGRSGEAVQILESLEEEKPGDYVVAANLGTAYELAGDNDRALRWIKEGIRRNPNAHDGSEWLHAKILEAKIAQQKDAAFFEKHSVLELQPARIGKKVLIGEQHLSSEKLAQDIEYQLTERLQFVKPPDAAVASLLFDFAAIDAVTHSLESAKTVLQLALDYGYPASKVQPLLKQFDQRIMVGNIELYGFVAVIGVSIVWLLVYLYKRRIFVISSRD